MANAITDLKSNLAPRDDELPFEFYKPAADVILPWLEQIFWEVCETEVLPTDWGTAASLSLFGICDKMGWSDYGDTCFINVAAKTFTAPEDVGLFALNGVASGQAWATSIRLQACLWSRRQMFPCTKSRVHQVFMRFIRLYGWHMVLEISAREATSDLR